MHSSTHSQTFSLPIPLYNSTPIPYMISGEWGIVMRNLFCTLQDVELIIDQGFQSETLAETIV